MEKGLYFDLATAIQLFYTSQSNQFEECERRLNEYFSYPASWITIKSMLAIPEITSKVKLFLFTQLHSKLLFGYHTISKTDDPIHTRKLLIYHLQTSSDANLIKYCSKSLAILAMHTINKWHDCIEELIKSFFVKQKLLISFLVIGVKLFTRIWLILPAIRK